MMSALRFIAVPVLLALAACSLPAPYQTYSPGTAPPPPRQQAALKVYGTTTTTPDNQYDFDQQAAADTFAMPVVPAPTSTSDSTQTTSQRVAICYSRLWNSAEAIRNAATQACGSNSNPRVVNQGFDLNSCPLLTPTQAVFSCSGP